MGKKKTQPYLVKRNRWISGGFSQTLMCLVVGSLPPTQKDNLMFNWIWFCRDVQFKTRELNVQERCVLCRAFLPRINQWVRLSLEPGGEAFHQLEIRTLYWSHSPCMFDITETPLFSVTLGFQSIPISIEHRGVSSLQRHSWEVMCFWCSSGSFFLLSSTHLSYCSLLLYNRLPVLQRLCPRMQRIFSLSFFCFEMTLLFWKGFPNAWFFFRLYFFII